MTYQHCIFDMDKTITPPRSQISDTMHQRLRSLPTTITVISGGTTERINTQTNQVADFILGACGNEARSRDQKQL
jgi:hydroxymethylpyrimidine pyrophosphatase-like HAD family hydrolase